MTRKCIIHIKDEVNVRFLEVDPATRRKLKAAVEFYVPGAQYTPAVKLGRWDGKMSFCDVGGRTYINLLDRLLPILVESEYEFDIVDDRETHNFEFELIREESFSHIKWPEKHPMAGEPIVFRDYQVEIINRFLANPHSIQQVATGAGKTLTTAALSYCVEPYGRSIVIVPNKDLVVQTSLDYENMGLDVGVLFGDKKQYTNKHIICTWQSVESLIKDAKKGTRSEELESLLEGLVALVVDETHRAKGSVLREHLSTVFCNVPIRWGLTGTMPKEDHESIACISTIGPVIGQLTSKELQDKGVLSQLDINVLQLQDGVQEFGNYASELKWLTTNDRRIGYLATLINGLAEQGNTLVLIDRIATGDILQSMEPEWVFLSGSTKQKDRQDEYESINDSDNKVIVATYGIASTGINIPRIFNLVLLEPGKSFVRVIQSIGRGIRKAKDKDYVAVYDITSNLKYSKRHLTKRKQFYREQKFPHTVTKVKY